MTKTIFILVVSLLTASSAMANIVTNGSFEDLTNFSLSNGSWGQSRTLVGWTQNNGDSFEIQLAGSGSFNPAYDGVHYLELNANWLGDISQVLQTVPGHTYQLSFGYSGRSDSGTNNDSLLDVLWKGVKLDATTVDEAPNSGWHTFNYTVTATGANTALEFISRGPTNNASYGSYLDGVSVNPIPEPATLALMLTGVGMIGFTRRKQKKN